MELDGGLKGGDLALVVGHAGKAEQVDGDPAAPSTQRRHRRVHLLQAVVLGAVVGPEEVVVEAEDAHPGAIQAGVDHGLDHLRAAAVGIDVDEGVGPCRLDPRHHLRQVGSHQRFALTALAEAHDFRLVATQVPGGQLHDLVGGGPEADPVLGRFDLPPLL